MCLLVCLNMCSIFSTVHPVCGWICFVFFPASTLRMAGYVFFFQHQPCVWHVLYVFQHQPCVWHVLYVFQHQPCVWLGICMVTQWSDHHCGWLSWVVLDWLKIRNSSWCCTGQFIRNSLLCLSSLVNFLCSTILRDNSSFLMELMQSFWKC